MTTAERRSQDVRKRPEPEPAPTETPSTWLTVAASIVGCSLIGWGIWQIYPPAVPIFTGLVIWRGALRYARERKERNDAAKAG